MDAVERAKWCDGCGVEMSWTPILAQGRRFCCTVCAGGGTCQCGYGVADDDEEEGPAII